MLTRKVYFRVSRAWRPSRGKVSPRSLATFFLCKPAPHSSGAESPIHQEMLRAKAGRPRLRSSLLGNGSRKNTLSSRFPPIPRLTPLSHQYTGIPVDTGATAACVVHVAPLWKRKCSQRGVHSSSTVDWSARPPLAVRASPGSRVVALRGRISCVGNPQSWRFTATPARLCLPLAYAKAPTRAGFKGPGPRARGPRLASPHKT